MNIRFYFSTTSLTQNNLRVTSGDKGHFVKQADDLYAAPIAEASIEGSYYYTTGHKISHPLLASSVEYMTTRIYEKAVLTTGNYSGEGWEAVLSSLGADQTHIDIKVDGGDVQKLKAVHHQLATGQLLPSFVVKDKRLTSKQVADVVFGEGDREHWLHVVQSAQDTILRTAGTISFLQGQVAALEAKIVELSVK